MTSKSIKIIFDTNVWISFLIGKKLSFIKKFIVSEEIVIITTQQLLDEMTEVTGRERLKKYFPQEKVRDLINLLEAIAVKTSITPTHFITD